MGDLVKRFTFFRKRNEHGDPASVIGVVLSKKNGRGHALQTESRRECTL
jgi:hypothetical protein